MDLRCAGVFFCAFRVQSRGHGSAQSEQLRRKIPVSCLHFGIEIRVGFAQR